MFLGANAKLLELLEGFHIVSDRLGVGVRKSGHRFFVWRFLGVVAFRQQGDDVIRRKAGAFQGRPHLAAAIGAVASGALGFVSGGSVFSEGWLWENNAEGQHEDEKQNQQLANSHDSSLKWVYGMSPKFKGIVRRENIEGNIFRV
jgi:hypothetical protein